VETRPSGKVTVSVHVELEKEYPETITQTSEDKVLGLDFMMNGLYASSEGGFCEMPRYNRELEEKLAKEQRKLSRRAEGAKKLGVPLSEAKNYQKQKVKVAKLQEKTANQRRDFLHKESRRIANAYDFVGVEDLDMKGMSQALNFGKSVHDNGWGMFTCFMGYKLAEKGGRLIKISRWYPSTRTCPVCGAIKPGSEMPLSEKLFACGCGHAAHRDTNASVNTKKEALRILEGLGITCTAGQGAAEPPAAISPFAGIEPGIPQGRPLPCMGAAHMPASVPCSREAPTSIA
jgi:putative transposase